MTKEEKIAELINIRDNFNYTLALREVFDDAIKALEQEHNLDKIRAEIVELDNKVCQQFLIEDVDKEVHHAYQDCLNIIDKYRTEGEK